MSRVPWALMPYDPTAAKPFSRHGLFATTAARNEDSKIIANQLMLWCNIATLTVWTDCKVDGRVTGVIDMHRHGSIQVSRTFMTGRGSRSQEVFQARDGIVPRGLPSGVKLSDSKCALVSQEFIECPGGTLSGQLDKLLGELVLRAWGESHRERNCRVDTSDGQPEEGLIMLDHWSKGSLSISIHSEGDDSPACLLEGRKLLGKGRLGLSSISRIPYRLGVSM